MLAYAQFTREHKKDKKEALELYRQAAARSYDDPEVHAELAEFLTEDMKDFKEIKDGRLVTAAALAEEQLVLAVEVYIYIYIYIYI